MKDKIARYDWAVPGDDGQYRCIAISDLKIDHSYQRAEVGDDTILTSARGGRSAKACQVLEGMGYTNVKNLEGGYLAYQALD
jgi:rhodanese-related sulfurtransferase